MLDLFYKLKNAFDCSTISNNLFEKTIKSIKWTATYFADSEYYFVCNGGIFTTPSLNPFDISKDWRPSLLTKDGSLLEL